MTCAVANFQSCIAIPFRKHQKYSKGEKNQKPKPKSTKQKHQTSKQNQTNKQTKKTQQFLHVMLKDQDPAQSEPNIISPHFSLL